MSSRQGITIIAKIKPGRLDSLLVLLAEIARSPQSNAVLPFDLISGLHFARWVIIPGKATDGEAVRASELLYASNFDGTRQSHLQLLVDKCGPGLDRIFEHCEDYPPSAGRTPERRMAFLQACSVPFGSLYYATTGTVAEIQAEAVLRDKIEAGLDTRDWKSADAESVAGAIRGQVTSDPLLGRVVAGESRPGWGWKLKYWSATVAAGLLALIFLPVTLPIAIAWLLAVRYHEKRESVAVPSGDQSKVSALIELEDRAVQNQLTIIADIKPSWFRRATVRGVLTILYAMVALRVPLRNSYMGVKTIHFGRFILIDKGHRLLFMSDYDGSWESYLGDFVDRLSFGISAVWSNATGFPETRFLFFGGARHEQVFKALVRDHQLAPAVWYSAYENLTVRNIKNNAAIREGLKRDLNGSTLLQWLRRF